MAANILDPSRVARSRPKTPRLCCTHSVNMLPNFVGPRDNLTRAGERTSATIVHCAARSPLKGACDLIVVQGLRNREGQWSADKRLPRGTGMGRTETWNQLTAHSTRRPPRREAESNTRCETIGLGRPNMSCLSTEALSIPVLTASVGSRTPLRFTPSSSGQLQILVR